MPRIYATSADYATWTGTTAPSGIDATLRRASIVLDEMLRAATYAVDTATGLPTDADVDAAFTEACCAQAEYQRARGDNLAVGAGQTSSFSIGGITVQKAGVAGGAVAAGGVQLPAHWSPIAWELLQQLPVDVINWSPWNI